MEQKKEQVLIIGYGNTLRSDDGIGQLVAMEVEKWDLPQVKSLYLHQLTPELAEKIAQFARVIFIDASIEIAKVTLKSIKDSQNNQNWTHHLTPASLVYLTEFLYKQIPQTWLIEIPIQNLDFGEEISHLAQVGKDEALEIIKNITKLTTEKLIM